MELSKSYQPRISNLLNTFGIFHLIEILVAFGTIICMAVTTTNRPINEFGFVIFVGVFAAVYSIIWCIFLVLAVWPPGTPLNQYVRIVGSFIVSQFYLAAFAVCCVVANVVGLYEYETARTQFGVAAFFTAVGWVVQAADTFMAWWHYGGINSPSQKLNQPPQIYGNGNGSGNGKNGNGKNGNGNGTAL